MIFIAKKFIPLILSFGVSLVLLLLLIDIFRNNKSSIEFISIDSQYLIVPAIIIVGLLKYFFNITLIPFIKKILLYVVLPLFATSCIILSFWDAVSPPNTVFTITQLHQSEIGFIAFFTFFILLTQQTSAWWKKYWQQIITITPYVTIFALFVVRFWPFDFFIIATHEDHAIEVIQCLVLLAGSIWCGIRAIENFKKGNRLKFIQLLICTILFFFVAGEEISWGQRILNIETPSFFETHNRQKETTIHNIEKIEWMVQWGYLSISALGLFGRSLAKKLLSGKLKEFYTWFPTIHYAGYFLFPFIFYFEQRITQFGLWHIWIEPIELFIYTGIVLWVSRRLQ